MKASHVSIVIVAVVLGVALGLGGYTLAFVLYARIDKTTAAANSNIAAQRPE